LLIIFICANAGDDTQRRSCCFERGKGNKQISVSRGNNSSVD